MTETQSWYTVREFADLIGWQRRLVRKYLKQRLIKGVKTQPTNIGWRIPREEMVRWGLVEENELP